MIRQRLPQQLCGAALDIAELHRPANASVVVILHYHWDGAQRALEEDSP